MSRLDATVLLLSAAIALCCSSCGRRTAPGVKRVQSLTIRGVALHMRVAQLPDDVLDASGGKIVRDGKLDISVGPGFGMVLQVREGLVTSVISDEVESQGQPLFPKYPRMASVEALLGRPTEHLQLEPIEGDETWYWRDYDLYVHALDSTARLYQLDVRPPNMLSD